MNKEQMNNYLDNMTFPANTSCFSTLPTAVPPIAKIAYGVKEEKGNKPMRYDNTAIAAVNTPKSDIATQRDYLLSRLAKSEYPKEIELRKLFNIGVDNTPKTYAQLIEMIKENKYTLDEKETSRVDEYMADGGYNPYGPTRGIVWDGPKPDKAGYKAGLEDMAKEFDATKDTIMVFSAEDGLKAVQAFEAWTPTGTAN